MEPEGMVHALDLIRDLLKPGGCLIDIHPTDIPATISIAQGAMVIPAGTVAETDDYIEYRQADQALLDKLQSGDFKLEAKDIFMFNIHASSLQELGDYLAKNWRDARLPDDLDQTISAHADNFRRVPAELSLIISEQIQINRLLRTDP